MKDSFSEINDLLEIASDSVKNNSVIVNSQETPTPYFLHITGERSPSYIPRIGHRQGSKEDRTMPRVTVATTLLGCIIGYATLLDTFINQATLSGKGVYSKWKGGLYIQKLPFKQALKPNSKLVYDVNATDEHWLVTYNEDTKQFYSEVIGKLIIDEVSLKPVGKEAVDQVFSLFLEINETIFFSEKEKLEPGYYNVKFPLNNKTTWKTTKEITIVSISKDDFKNRKAIVASNLSSVQQTIFQRW